MELVTSFLDRRRGAARMSDADRRVGARRGLAAAPRRAGLVALLLGTVLGLGACATARTSVALRGADDLRPAEGERYVLPDSAEAEAGRSWGFLSHESLVIYRPELANERRARDGRTRYRREVEKVGRGGVAISAATILVLAGVALSIAASFERSAV